MFILVYIAFIKCQTYCITSFVENDWLDSILLSATINVNKDKNAEIALTFGKVHSDGEIIIKRDRKPYLRTASIRNK